jgi:hypothetical protein
MIVIVPGLDGFGGGDGINGHFLGVEAELGQGAGDGFESEGGDPGDGAAGEIGGDVEGEVEDVDFAAGRVLGGAGRGIDGEGGEGGIGEGAPAAAEFVEGIGLKGWGEEETGEEDEEGEEAGDEAGAAGWDWVWAGGVHGRKEQGRWMAVASWAR